MRAANYVAVGGASSTLTQVKRKYYCLITFSYLLNSDGRFFLLKHLGSILNMPTLWDELLAFFCLLDL